MSLFVVEQEWCPIKLQRVVLRCKDQLSRDKAFRGEDN